MKKKIFLIAVIALLVIVLANSVYTVRENQYACRVQFSKIVVCAASASCCRTSSASVSPVWTASSASV